MKLLQLEVGSKPRGDGPLKVRAAQKRSLDAAGGANPELLGRQAADAIADMLATGEFSSRRVIASLPRQIVQVKNLRLPQMPAAELAAVVQAEAKNIFDISGDDAQVEFLPAGEVRQGSDIRQEVIVLAAKRKEIDSFIEQIHRTGLLIDSLDVEPCALYRVIDRFLRRRQDEQEVHVIIDLGMQRSQVLIGKGHDINFYKPVDVGGMKLNDAVSRKLAIRIEDARAVRRRLWSPDDSGQKRDPVRQAVMDATRSIMEELAQEVSLCMRYYSVTFRGQRPCRVRLLGGEAGDPQLLAILSSALGVPVTEGRPLYSINCDSMNGFDRKGHSSEWALAVGLSLKHTQGRFAPLDGTPRTLPETQSKAQVIDLNAALAPPAARVGPVIAAREEAVHA